MTKLLTVEELAQHRSSDAPAREHVRSVDVLLRLYLKPGGSIRTWNDWAVGSTWLQVHHMRWIGKLTSRGAREGGLAAADVQFCETALRRLFIAMYYEKSKGNALATNYRDSREDSHGRGLDGLLTKHGGNLELVYTEVQQVSTVNSARESKQLPNWPAVIRHARRAQWTVRYWCAAITAAPVDGAPYQIHHMDALAAERDAAGVAGWAWTNEERVELQIEWADGVYAQQDGATQAEGCGCRKLRCENNRCPCRKAKRACGAYCACQGPSGAWCRGIGCGCGDMDTEAASASGETLTEDEARVQVVVRTELSEDEENFYASMSSDDDEAAVEEDDTVEGLREDESGDVLSDSDAEEEESAEEGGDVDVDGDEDESESGSEDEDVDDDDDDEEEEDADDEDEEETHPLFV